MRIAIGVFVLASVALAADSNGAARGRKEEDFSCVQCHSVRLIHSQRLSKATWSKELDKMAGWGAPIRDRQALLDYLAVEYSDLKPMAPVERSGQGSTPK